MPGFGFKCFLKGILGAKFRVRLYGCYECHLRFLVKLHVWKATWNSSTFSVWVVFGLEIFTQHF